MNKLKPCPFCGETPHIGEGFSPSIHRGFNVQCNNCDLIFGLKGTKRAIIAAWNRRVEVTK